MARLAAQQLDKYFGERALFTGLSFEIGDTDNAFFAGTGHTAYGIIYFVIGNSAVF